ncbi:hypothetical protein VPHD81_0133 [Vibrio phage D81]
MAKKGEKDKVKRESNGRFKKGASGNVNGQPEKYTKEWADKIAKDLPDMFKNGESHAEVCAALRMSKNSFYKACEISSDFKEAYEMGTLLSEAWWQKLGRAGSAGQVKIQPITWKFNMQNRFGWAEKMDQTQNVSATVNNTFNKEDYEKAEQELTEEFKDLD